MLASYCNLSWLQTSSDAELKVASSADVDRLQHLFDLIRECRDDRQERSWAVRDDLSTIAGHLQEMLKLLVRDTGGERILSAMGGMCGCGLHYDL